MQHLLGNKDPKLSQKDTLRQYYGKSRVDNAIFISDNYSESILEKDLLFTEHESKLLLKEEGDEVQIKRKHPQNVLSGSQ
mmetsp:Transcript_19112/g.18246  ORF Transcript_19112/g.18246 Transcript_19112/m.18246 type:complete len:80 (+) Transcript_19112:349-588(+)|eukprot:CAMPEP_0170553072 /NCGR_PEP_ID=MMETSP0211-20121228/10930_1 /TAXON_ID=311385 /ORGANISM="Pseudokeronopsis sp., Strain OXSARD2" /LENGTH=79 /DNA_ID=CAMNT_0010861199 /DNA_START=301 /DNA_END=540 /DNA_ORIENTATION=+